MNNKIKHTNIPDGFPYNGQACFLEGSSNLKDYLMGGFDNQMRNTTASIVLEKLIKKYGIPECGMNRATFMSKNYVIKFPLNDNGEKDNHFEGSFVSDNTAKGKSFQIKDFICLIQERLTLIDNVTNNSNYPDWIKVVDSGQIGLNNRGKLKAYDFGDIHNNQIKINKIKC